MFVCNFPRNVSSSYIILRIQRLEGKQLDLDEVAHYEPPHQDLRCLQIQLFSSLVLKELRLFDCLSNSFGVQIVFKENLQGS